MHDGCFVRHSKRRSTTLSVAIGRKKQGVLPQTDVDGRKTNYLFDFDLQKSTTLSSHKSQLDPIEKANTNATSTKPNESISKPISTMMKFFYALLVALVLASTNGVFADVSAEILENAEEPMQPESEQVKETPGLRGLQSWNGPPKSLGCNWCTIDDDFYWRRPPTPPCCGRIGNLLGICHIEWYIKYFCRW